MQEQLSHLPPRCQYTVSGAVLAVLGETPANHCSLLDASRRRAGRSWHLSEEPGGGGGASRRTKAASQHQVAKAKKERLKEGKGLA